VSFQEDLFFSAVHEQRSKLRGRLSERDSQLPHNALAAQRLRYFPEPFLIRHVFPAKRHFFIVCPRVTPHPVVEPFNIVENRYPGRVEGFARFSRMDRATPDNVATIAVNTRVAGTSPNP
jgi:hypothetical protein